MEVDEEEPTAEAAAGGEEGEAADVVVGEEEPTTAAQIGSQAGRQAGGHPRYLDAKTRSDGTSMTGGGRK